MQGRKGILQTRAPASKGPYIICMQKAPYRYAGSPCDRESLQKMTPTDKATLQARCPYMQGATTDKGPLQTRGLHRQGVYTDKGPLQTRGSIDTVQFLQTMSPYRQGPLQTRVPYRPETHTDTGPPHTLCNFYRRQGAPTWYTCKAASDPTDRDPLLNKGLFQTLCNSYRKRAITNKGPLHDIQARGPYW